MATRCISVLMVWCMGVMLPAQTFNNVHHNQNFLGGSARSIFEQEDGYLMFSVQWALDTTIYALYITKFDLAGMFLWEVIHQTDRNVDPGVIDPIASLSQGGYAAAMTFFGIGDTSRTYLYRFDAEGDTLWTKFLSQESGTRQLLQLPDGGFLHCGWQGAMDEPANIMRLDSAGNVLWEHDYPPYTYIFSATPLSDGDFLLGSGRNQWPDRGVIIKVDSLGEQEWIRTFGGHASTSGRRIVELADGSILLPGAWETTSAPTQSNNQHASIYKYSTTGSLIWRKDLFYGNQARIGFLCRAADDLLWAVGGARQFDQGPRYYSDVMKVTEEADTLWRRKYWHFDSSSSDNAIYAATPTSDGGLVMTGLTRQGPDDPHPNLASCWLLKVDEHGCVVPGCHTVGVQEYATDLNQYFKLWPNPLAQNTPINFSFEPPHGFQQNGDLRAVMLDAMGREVRSQHYPDHASQFTLETSGLASGIYHLHLTDQRSWLAGAKVVVE